MLKKLRGLLPERIYFAIERAGCGGLIEEVRIRKNRQAYIIRDGANAYLDVIASQDEMIYILERASKYSLYAYRDSIVQGYISLDGGIRIGIVGRASIENGCVVGVYDVNEFAIRLPNILKVSCGSLFALAKDKSLLIYSPPGVGKTTLLRNLIRSLSSGAEAKRVSAVDTRGELAYGLEAKDLLVTVLSGYPRKLGIEIAIRTMNAQIIVCDEIGDERDASAIIDAQGAGVPILATCHGNSIKDILSHTGIRALHEARIFDYYVGIKRSAELEFEYSIVAWEVAENDNL